ncbi:SDR family NAD(P)-dependent oxidoreductase [Ralstonia soli]|uniref:SDR family oxidoreductase n=1 Tax=Ralstonia soli TaxID=2953896 RepID=A0ABT1AGF3_9RALS|nr:glucose 1-dehydrogenase [Ralstonia soli]MCO5397383.1 SDR family oxidoreductase [Ralstonia soli]
MKEFNDKVVLITGGSTGIGRAAAAAFARDGAKLVLADVNADVGEAFAAELRKGGSDALFVRTDVSRAEDCEAMVARALETFGRLDVAFNNAGISDAPQTATPEYSLDLWEKIIGINLSGVFYCMRYEIPALLKSGGGAIINTSSIAGQIAFPGTAGYTASKHGVVGLTKVVAAEYGARGIRCNALAPGMIETPMTKAALDSEQARAAMLPGIPARRFGKPEEMADVVVWLGSSRASYVNGAYIAADGGYLIQ